MIDLKRAIELLKAASNFLHKLDENPFADGMATIVYYDQADCDEGCLMDDIDFFLMIVMCKEVW